VPSTSTSNPAAQAYAIEPRGRKQAGRRTRAWLVVKRAVVAIFAAGCLGYGLLFAFHLEPVVMLTGSMGSTIPPGSLIIDRRVAPATLKVGDTITFEKPLGEPGLDTHRIIAIAHSNGHTSYQTKGDANPVEDPWTIEFKNQTAHQVIYSVPRLGWLLLLLRTPIFRDLVLVAALLVVFSTVLKALAVAGAANTTAASIATPPDVRR
jgi:signal peptidase I